MLTGCRRKKAASGQEVERGGEQRLCQRIDSRGFAFARTANAERHLATKALLELPQPGCRARRRARIAGIDDQEGFAVLAGPLQRPRRANRGAKPLLSVMMRLALLSRTFHSVRCKGCD